MKKLKALLNLFLVVLLYGSIGGAYSQSTEFPAREIRLVVPWNVGGSNDISARQLSKILASDGITLVVENVPGATGTIGMTRVANANPDGYTIGMGTSSTLSMIAQGLTQLKNEIGRAHV